MGIFGGGGYADDGPYTPTKHNETCHRLGQQARSARPNARIRVDHCAWDEGQPTPRQGSCGNTYIPDFELVEGNLRVIGEVETVKRLNSRTLAQLQGIRTQGFVPIIVFPKEDIDRGSDWVEYQGLHWAEVMTPWEVGDYLREPGFFASIFQNF